MRYTCLLLLVVCTGLAAAGAVDVQVVATYAHGRRAVTNAVPLVRQADGAWRLRIAKTAIDPKAETLDVYYPGARAQKGEDGFWVLSDGQYGTFRCDDGATRRTPRRVLMPVFGMKTPRGAFVAIVKGLRLECDFAVAAERGAYRAWATFRPAQIGRPVYEDAVIDFIPLAGDAATYAGMARVYRDYQLARGAVKPLAARAKGSPTLAYTAESIFVRVKHGFKALNTEEAQKRKWEHQSPGHEPPIRTLISFDRFMEIMRAMKAAGIGRAEVCSVGGTAGGFDGRFPDVLPIPDEFGGEAKLRAAVKLGHDLGYQMVCHFCTTAMFECSREWNEDFICRRPDGQMLKSGIVAGGRTHRLCPRVYLDRFIQRDWKTFRDFGFRGTHHIDVISCIPPYSCFHPDHPLDASGSAACMNEIAAYSRQTFGGFGSESGFDWIAPNLDFALYVSWYPGHNSHEETPLVDRIVPFWQLVYHGIVVSNPFYATIDAYLPREKSTLSDNMATYAYLGDVRTRVLKLHEFGGRPVFYYTRYEDVAPLKRAADDYARFSHLQYQFMDDHRELVPGVFLTRYANGEETVVNYSDAPFAWKEREVAGHAIELFK